MDDKSCVSYFLVPKFKISHEVCNASVIQVQWDIDWQKLANNIHGLDLQVRLGNITNLILKSTI